MREWEPRDALVEEGQTFALVEAARSVLRPGGWLVLETHGDGAGQVIEQLRDSGYVEPATTRDLAHRERVVEARWEP